MSGIIVAFPKPEDAKAVRSVLTRGGFDVNAVCTSGAAVLQAVDRLGEGIIICGYRLRDMTGPQLYELAAPAFSMLLICSGRAAGEDIHPGICCLRMPVSVHALIDHVNMLLDELRLEKKKKRREKQRSRMQQSVIDRAKELLMQRNGMTEEEAYRYLQKTSMDSGTGMAETAGMLVSLMEDNT